MGGLIKESGSKDYVSLIMIIYFLNSRYITVPTYW